MRKINFIVFTLFVMLIGCFTLFSLGKSNGQTNSASSNQCIVCTQVVPSCLSNEILIPQSCNECARCVSTSSTSSGCPQIHTDCAGKLPRCKSKFGIYDPKICKCICPDSLSDSENTTTLNKKFTGIWKSKISNGSLKVIQLRLCVKNQKLEGIINIPEEVENGKIISQNIISDNEVSVTVKSENDLIKELNLKLIDKKHLQVLISSSQTFEIRKLSSLRGCLKDSCKNLCGTLCCGEGQTCKIDDPCMGDPTCTSVPGFSCSEL